MKTRFLARVALVGLAALALGTWAAPALAQGSGALHGRVVDETGKPVADVSMTFTFLGDVDRSFTAKTDARGNWVRAALTPGPWKITVSKGDLVGSVPNVLVLIGQNTAMPDITLGQPAAPAPGAGGGGASRSIVVTALDASGAAVKGLTASDFTVREDNASRTVTSVQPANDPLFISVLIDTTKPPLGVNPPIRDLRVGLTTFIKTVQAANPNAQIELMECGGAAQTQVNFTTSAADLDKYIQRMVMSQRSGAVFLEALVEASKDLSKRPAGRKAIVGVVFNSVESSSLLEGPVNNEVAKSGASLWTISIHRDDPQSVQNLSSGNSPTRENLVNSLTTATGGGKLSALETPALEGLLKQIADGLTSQYVVSYARPAGAAGQNIQVTSSKAVKVIAARSSTAGPIASSATPSKLSAEEIAKRNKHQEELAQSFKDGDAALEAGNFDDAIAKFTAIAAEVPKCASCHAKIGDVYLKKGDLDNAEKSYLKAIEVDPAQPDAYSALAGIYNTQKKFDEATKMSAKANELQGAVGGSDPAAVYNQGIILWNQSKIPEAKAMFQKVIELDPKMADAHYWLGMATVNEGKLADSKKSFEEYLKLAPTGQYADTAKAILATIK